MKFCPSFTFARQALALTALFSAGCLGASAQQTDTGPAAAKLDLRTPLIEPAAEFSSSSADNDVAVAANHFDFVNVAAAMQPPPRRYGRPRYRGSNTNADGSNKYAFLIGAGFTQPVGNTYHYLKPSYGFQVGGGRNFNKQVGLILQFDYDNFGFNGRTISQQSYLYFNDPTNSQYGLDGSSHVWSITLNPTFTLYSGEGLGAYFVVGGGFYHKTANFTIPVPALGYDPYYGYYQYAANESIDKYTSNAGGVNGGFGLTYKLSRFSGQRLYGEVRYVFVDNQQRRGITVATASQATATTTNFFPANSNRTTYFPVKFGLRF